MKLLTKTKYIVCWHIAVGDIPSHFVQQHVDSFKEYMENGVKYELEAFLEAPVLLFYIPNRTNKTELEIKKIKVEEYAEET